MKKIFIISASILVAFGIAACGSGKSENTTTEAIKETTFVSEKENTGKTESIESSAVYENMEHTTDRYSVNEAFKFDKDYADPEEFDVEPWLDIFEELGLTKEFPRPKANGTTGMSIYYNSAPLGPDSNTGEPREGVSRRHFSLYASHSSYRQYREELYDYVCNQVVPFYDSKYTLVEDVTQDPDFEMEYESDYNTHFTWKKIYSDEEGNEYKINFNRDLSCNGAGLEIWYTAHE